MGSYLLLEGKITECFEWFNLAKKAKYYVNREFPYINSGKAYLMEKKYGQALDEFNQALRYVPYQKELVKTIRKLKGLMKNKESENPSTSELQ
jgi:Tfp pilus assembly protein PilF